MKVQLYFSSKTFQGWTNMKELVFALLLEIDRFLAKHKYLRCSLEAPKFVSLFWLYFQK